MFIKIPFESEIPFKTNISEITKMSLEHDFNVNDEVVLGNFYVSGEYRSHEVSVNTEKFNFTLPFSVSYRDDLIKDTLEFNIEDFTYEIIDNNKLKVFIEYSLKGEVKEELFERVDESKLESELAYIDNFLDNDHINNNSDEENIVDDKDELTNYIDNNKKETITCDNKEERLGEKEEKTIMETIKDSDDTFVTYHIHIFKENDTIESICTMYNVNKNFLSDYNNIEEIAIGEKILIPLMDE